MRKCADIAPDDRRGWARKGPDCRERVKATRSLPETETEETETEVTDTPIRGVRWDMSHNTVGQRHATGSRAALDFFSPVPWVPAHRVRSRIRSRSR
jgi:hypothetical protein